MKISRHPTVVAIGVGVLLVAAAGLFKLYVDQGVLDPGAEREVIKEHMLSLHDALSARASSEEASASLPTFTPWLPAALKCGEVDASLPSDEDAASWRSLGWPLTTHETPYRYRYQIAIRRRGDAITWYARRDGDCDGIYEVHTLKASLGWGGSLRSRHVETQNLGE